MTPLALQTKLTGMKLWLGVAGGAGRWRVGIGLVCMTRFAGHRGMCPGQDKVLVVVEICQTIVPIVASHTVITIPFLMLSHVIWGVVSMAGDAVYGLSPKLAQMMAAFAV